MNFTCGAAFKPGTYSRSNANCDGTRFLAVESDALARDEVGAVFAYLNRRLHFNLQAVVDTAGKSLHGWFDAPRDRRGRSTAQGRPDGVRVRPETVHLFPGRARAGGAWRNGKLQRWPVGGGWCR